MDIQDSKNSVREEQFSEDAENKKEEIREVETPSAKTESEENNKIEFSSDNPNQDQNPDSIESVEAEIPEKPKKDIKKEDASAKPDKPKKARLKSKPSLSTKEDAKVNENSDSEETEDQTTTAESGGPTAHQKELINFSLLSKEDLVKVLEETIENRAQKDIREDVDTIKGFFYKKYKAEIEELRKEYLKAGGKAEDFKPNPDPDEEKVRALLKSYREIRSEQLRMLENEKDENLKKKYALIEEIKDLSQRDESINKTFQEFRDIQKRWYEIGQIPQQNVKHLWETYHYYVEKFYDYIKINNELRDLDLKKNLEKKIELCEKAEALLLEPNILNAFQILQKFHEQWREIGPVTKESRTEIWDRFKEVTSKINKKHQQYYQELKDSQKKNLLAKTELCKKAESLIAEEITSHDEWVKKTRAIIELQKVWKTIGFAPKKDNNRIYEQFRKACDTFFNRKRDFYASNMQEQNENLAKKIELCLAAEALQESTDWQKTTDELIALQKKWKKTGPVPRKDSDVVWKRFRAACDKFFNNKSTFFSKIDTTYEANLSRKLDLIKEIEDFKPGDNLKQNLQDLNLFQKRWTEIGFVPYNKKEEIMQAYRVAINNHFDNLEMDDHRKNMLKFKNKLESILQKPRPDVKLRFERDKLMTKLTQLKTDIGVWENNIGFFAETSKAESMIKDFGKKIAEAHETIRLLEEKILLIDEMDNE
jgi:Domain of Unknown Function (DUF349)